LLRKEVQIIYIYLCGRLVCGQLDALCLALCLFTKLQTCDGGKYRGADKSLDGPTSRCILFDGENISFVASLVLFI